MFTQERIKMVAPCRKLHPAACSLLISLYVINEASYDKFNTKKDRIFRAILNGKIGGKEVTIATSPAIMGPTMLREFPEVEDYLRMTRKGPSVVEYKNQALMYLKILILRLICSLLF